jgi:serine protease inhibitor ecotin
MNEQEMFNKQLGLQASMPYINASTSMQGALSDLSNPDKDIYALELSLKGKIINADGKEVSFGEPLCNEKGIASVIRIVKSMCQQVAILSNLEDDDVRKLTIYLGETLVSDMVFNKETYEIKTDRARSQIALIATATGFTAGMRSLENGERRLLKGGIMETTIKTENTGGSKGKGFMDMVKNSFK